MLDMPAFSFNLPKDYSGSPTVSLYTPWTEAEVPSYITAGSGSDAITDLNLEYLYGPEPEKMLRLFT